MAEHSTLTGADLHEPKGQAGAAVNTIYVADGAGSGTHKKVPLAALDTSTMVSPNEYLLTSVIPDVSTPSSILVPIPDTSVLSSIRMVLGGAITVANSLVSVLRNDGSSMGVVTTIPFAGSAEGAGATFTATLNQQVTGPGYVKILTDGGSTGTVPLYLTLRLLRVP